MAIDKVDDPNNSSIWKSVVAGGGGSCTATLPVVALVVHVVGGVGASSFNSVAIAIVSRWGG